MVEASWHAPTMAHSRAVDTALARIAEAGFDIAHAFDANAAARTPGWELLAGGEALGILIGNTRDAVAAVRRGDARSRARGRAPPARSLRRGDDRRAIAAVVPGARLYYAHRRYGGGFLPFQQLAVATGLGALAPNHLVIHPTYGPWFALRAVVVVRRHPSSGARADRAAVPVRGTLWRQPSRSRSPRRTGGPGSRSATRARSRAWRYGEEQIRYHYTHTWTGPSIPIEVGEAPTRDVGRGRFRMVSPGTLLAPPERVRSWLFALVIGGSLGGSLGLGGCGFAVPTEDEMELAEPDPGEPGEPSLPPVTRQCDTADPALRVCIDFEDTAMFAEDGSGRGHHATTRDVAVMPRGAENAILVDATSRVQIAEHPDLDIQGSLTVSLWMRADEFTGRVQYLLDNNRQYAISYQASGRIRCGLGTVTVDSLLSYFDQRWHHVACTFDGQQLKVWSTGTSRAAGPRPRSRPSARRASRSAPTWMRGPPTRTRSLVGWTTSRCSPVRGRMTSCARRMAVPRATRAAATTDDLPLTPRSVLGQLR